MPKKTTLLTPEEKAMRAALRRAQTKKTTEKKATKAKTARKAKREEAAQAQETAAALTREEFRNKLEQGTLQVPDVGDYRNLNFSNASQAISNNSTYHTALYSAISDIQKRLNDVENEEKENKEKPFKEQAAEMDAKNLAEWEEKRKNATTAEAALISKPEPVDWKTLTNGKDTLASKPTMQKLAGPQYLLNKANQLLRESYVAHQAGLSGDAFNNHVVAMQKFKEASDHVFNAIAAANNNFGKEKYGAVFNISKSKTLADYAQPGNEMSLSLDSDKKLEDVVNGYVNHVKSAGISSGVFHPEVADNITTDIVGGKAASYSQPLFGAEKNPTPNIRIPGFVFLPTFAERRAARAAKAATTTEATLTAEDKKARATTAATGETFAVNKDGILSTGKPTGTFVRATNWEDFPNRWKSQEILPFFEADENRNEESAKAAGVKYTKKTFIGSEANMNPDEWFNKYQIKNHWMNVTKGAPHEFDSWWETQKPHFASATDFANKNRIQLQEIAKPYSKWAEESGLSAFFPSQEESEAAEEFNQDKPPLATEQRQLSKASKSGARLSKEEMFTKLRSSVVSHPDKKGNDGKPLKVNFDDLEPEVQQKIVRKKLTEQNRRISITPVTKVSSKSASNIEQDIGEIPFVEDTEIKPEPSVTAKQANEMYGEQQSQPKHRQAFDEGRGV